MTSRARPPPRSRAPHSPRPSTGEDCILVFQGGGALGACQAGVFESLSKARRARTWVVLFGVPGFFKPRVPTAPFQPHGSLAAISCCDTAPLRETLEWLVDRDRINAGDVRLSVGAVTVRTGNFEYCDSSQPTIDARHNMASGAQPPWDARVRADLGQPGCHLTPGALVEYLPQATQLDTEDPIMKLKNKVCIVTGAASGIGKEIALTYAREGGRVVIADINKAAAQQAADEIVKAGGTAMAVAMDVTSEEQVNAAVAEVVAAWGTVDVLVSNAGIQTVHPVEAFPFADWKRMLAIHLDGAFLTTKAVMPHMQKSGNGGAIIYMGSVHSKEASVLKSAYVTAKHGLIGLCKTVAKEGGKHKIRANVICPGFVRTPLVEKQIPEQATALGISEDDVIKKVMLKETVDGEFTTVQDVAEVALLFAGFESNALTGQSLVVSHGWFMQ